MDEQQEAVMDVNPESEDGGKARRARRSKEELIAAIDSKIAAENARHERAIAKLEESKRNITKPRMTKKEKAKIVIEAAMKTHSPEELAELLGLDTSSLFS